MSTDSATRRRIRLGKTVIALLVFCLVVGLLRGGPWLPVLVGAIVNLGFTALLIRHVRQLERSLSQTPRNTDA